MKLALKDVLVAQGTVSAILQKKYPLSQLPVKLMYRLQKINTKLTSELEDFEKARLALIRTYVDGDLPDGQIISVPEDKLTEFRAEIEKMVNDEVEVNIQPVPYDLFANLDLEASAWLNLFPIIDDIELQTLSSQ